MIKSTKSGKLIGVANQKMIELLADNINSGDPSSVLKMVGVLLKIIPGFPSHNLNRVSVFY